MGTYMQNLDSTVTGPDGKVYPTTQDAVDSIEAGRGEAQTITIRAAQRPEILLGKGGFFAGAIFSGIIFMLADLLTPFADPSNGDFSPKEFTGHPVFSHCTFYRCKFDAGYLAPLGRRILTFGCNFDDCEGMEIISVNNTLPDQGYVNDGP